MTQTGGLVILYAWLIFAAFLAVLGYFVLRHEQDPWEDLDRSRADESAGHDQPPSGAPETGNSGS
jgi:hypothetical protein